MILLDAIIANIGRVVLATLAFLFVLYLMYVIYIRIVANMARRRHRDPIPWILVSIFASPLTAWIILLIIGDAEP